MIPLPVELRGSAILIGWLSQQLLAQVVGAYEVTLEQNARGFIIALLGSFLLVDKKGLHVHLCFLPLL